MFDKEALSAEPADRTSVKSCVKSYCGNRIRMYCLGSNYVKRDK